MLCDNCMGKFNREKIIRSKGKYLCEKCLTEQIKADIKEKKSFFQKIKFLFGK